MAAEGHRGTRHSLDSRLRHEADPGGSEARAPAPTVGCCVGRCGQWHQLAMHVTMRSTALRGAGRLLPRRVRAPADATSLCRCATVPAVVRRGLVGCPWAGRWRPAAATGSQAWEQREPSFPGRNWRRGFAKAAKGKKQKKQLGRGAKRTAYLPDDEVSVSQLAWLLQVPRETIEEGLQRIGAVSGLREATIDRAEAGLLAGVCARASRFHLPSHFLVQS